MTIPANTLLVQLRIPCRSANMTPSNAKGAAKTAQNCATARAKRQRSTTASPVNASDIVVGVGGKANRVMVRPAAKQASKKLQITQSTRPSIFGLTPNSQHGLATYTTGASRRARSFAQSVTSEGAHSLGDHQPPNTKKSIL